MEPIRLLVTGGTFDKQYNELTGALSFGETHLVEMLRLGRCRLDVSIQTLMMIDSLDMTGVDRARVVAACREAGEARLVITHGTDTMVETAGALAEALAPALARPSSSPARWCRTPSAARTGSSTSAARSRFAQLLPAGVYIAMNGRCFSWDGVRKNRETGVFEPT